MSGLSGDYIWSSGEYDDISESTASASSAPIPRTPSFLATTVGKPHSILNRRNSANMLTHDHAPFSIVRDNLHPTETPEEITDTSRNAETPDRSLLKPRNRQFPTSMHPEGSVIGRIPRSLKYDVEFSHFGPRVRKSDLYRGWNYRRSRHIARNSLGYERRKRIYFRYSLR